MSTDAATPDDEPIIRVRGLVNRFGERPLIVAGLVLQSGGMVWLAWLASPTVAYPALIVPLIVNRYRTSII